MSKLSSGVIGHSSPQVQKIGVSVLRTLLEAKSPLLHIFRSRRQLPEHSANSDNSKKRGIYIGIFLTICLAVLISTRWNEYSRCLVEDMEHIAHLVLLGIIVTRKWGTFSLLKGVNKSRKELQYKESIREG